jgi:hypothetical protein
MSWPSRFSNPVQRAAAFEAQADAPIGRIHEGHVATARRHRGSYRTRGVEHRREVGDQIFRISAATTNPDASVSAATR